MPDRTNKLIWLRLEDSKIKGKLKPVCTLDLFLFQKQIHDVAETHLILTNDFWHGALFILLNVYYVNEV